MRALIAPRGFVGVKRTGVTFWGCELSYTSRLDLLRVNYWNELLIVMQHYSQVLVTQSDSTDDESR